MQALIAVVMVPLAILNGIGGIVAVIWLAFLGEWAGLGLGLLAMMAGALVCSLLILPGILVAMPAAFLQDKGGILKVIGFLVGMISLLWTYIVMSGWGMYSFDFFIARASSDSWFPYLLLAYAVATTPWAYMASKEDNAYSAISVFFLQVASAVSIVMIGFVSMTAIAMFLTFAGIMLIGYVVNLFAGGVQMVLEMRMERGKAA